MYTATNETIAAPKAVSFIPSCSQIITLENIESMSDGQYVSFVCKIIDIGPVRSYEVFHHSVGSLLRMIPSYSITDQKEYRN